MVALPRVSVGLPVCNGERFLAEAVESVLAQSFRDFELIISDNGSVDETPRICGRYASVDSRVRYSRIERNQGASWNFKRTFELARGAYFQWLSHDDKLAPDMLLRCVSILDSRPEVVLCYPKVTLIDEEGRLIGTYGNRLEYGGSPEPRVRFRDILLAAHWCREVFGMMRKTALVRTKLIGPYIMSDIPLLAELALLGPFHEIDEHLFFSREHSGRSMRAHQAFHLRAVWFDPRSEGRITLPHWRLLFEYLDAVRRHGRGIRTRFTCLPIVWQWCRRHRDPLQLDLENALKRVYERSRKPKKPVTQAG